MGKESNQTRYQKTLDRISSYLEKEFGVDKKKLNSLESKLLGLKSVLRQVNNMLTYKLSASFVRDLKSCGLISEEEKSAELDRICNTSPNANGFDIEIDVSKRHKKILGEVKCNKPLDKSKTFSVAQRNSIIKDILKLSNNENAIKFMVALDDADVKKAFDEDAFIKKLDESDVEYEIVKKLAELSGRRLDAKKVYIVFCPIK